MGTSLKYLNGNITYFFIVCMCELIMLNLKNKTKHHLIFYSKKKERSKWLENPQRIEQ